MLAERKFLRPPNSLNFNLLGYHVWEAVIKHNSEQHQRGTEGKGGKKQEFTSLNKETVRKACRRFWESCGGRDWSQRLVRDSEVVWRSWLKPKACERFWSRLKVVIEAKGLWEILKSSEGRDWSQRLVRDSEVVWRSSLKPMAISWNKFNLQYFKIFSCNSGKYIWGSAVSVYFHFCLI